MTMRRNCTTAARFRHGATLKDEQALEVTRDRDDAAAAALCQHAPRRISHPFLFKCKALKAAPELCWVDVHPTCFVRKHQGVLSKFLPWCGDERRCGAAAHPFPVSSSKHRQNLFSNQRGPGRMASIRENG